MNMARDHQDEIDGHTDRMDVIMDEVRHLQREVESLRAELCCPHQPEVIDLTADEEEEGHFPYHTMPANDGFLDARPLFHSSRLPDTQVCGDLGFDIDQRTLRRRSGLALSCLLQELWQGC